MQVETGTTISHYRLLEKVGEGGMGVVYKALDTRLNRQVAVKVLPAGVAEDPERRRRFLREARAAAAVTHARIATVHDVDEADGILFIVMELVQGTSLRALIKGRPLPIPQALRLAKEITEGLSHAHAAHIVHRDLKPENVVVDPEGHAKILDFGLARLLEQQVEELRSRMSEADTVSEELTREGQVLGTAAYMSPEQVRGAAVDARSDIFSLGILLYEMVTGKRPFQGATPIETLSAILKDEPKPASHWVPTVPKGLEDLLGRCLNKDPAQRYSSAAVLHEALERLGAGNATAAAGAVPTPARRGRISTRRLLTWVAVMVALVVAVGFVAMSMRRTPPPDAATPGRIQSLAVLPLRNLSGDTEQEYFADGMTDELITHLSRIGTLRVVSRSSSMRYKGTSKSPREIARELNVEALVEGSVQRSGDRVRVSASLVGASTDSSLWAESYERDLRDVLALQSDVAGSIARIIKARLTPQEEERLAASRPVDPKAYEATLKGRHERNKSTKPSLQKALEHFQEALDHDPAYAPAYAGIADTYATLSSLHMTSKVALPKARAAARRAIDFDDKQAEAYAILGTVAVGLDHDWSAAEAAYRRALELNPSHAMARNYYGLFLSYLGRTDEALEQMNRAQELDPLSVWVAVGTAWPYIYAPPEKRDYRRAAVILEGIVETDPSFFNGHVNLAHVYSLLRQCDQAMDEAEESLALSEGDLGPLLWIGSIYATCGERARAEEVLRRAQSEASTTHVSPFLVSMIHAALGNHEKALEYLEIAYQEKDEIVVMALVEPHLDGLRSDPRFIDLLRRLNLPVQEGARPEVGAPSGTPR